jgi:hypothetical protein
MSSKPWHGPKWPEDVPYEISGYEKPLTSILDTTSKLYPDHTYTIFAGAKCTFAQVKDTADRVAHFLVSRGIEPGDRAEVPAQRRWRKGPLCHGPSHNLPNGRKGPGRLKRGDRRHLQR